MDDDAAAVLFLAGFGLTVLVIVLAVVLIGMAFGAWTWDQFVSVMV